MWKTFSSGVDWITATAANNDELANAIEDVALNELSIALRDTHTLKSGKRLQFEGIAAGSVFIGRSDTHTMLQSSGSAAHRTALALRERAPDAKVTRIDFEVTCQTPEPRPKLAREAYNAKEKENFRTQTGRQILAGVIAHPRNGDTFTIGARTSQRYGRFYNKSAEQRGKIAPNLWRCETELKQSAARSAWKAFCVSESPTALAASIVRSQFEVWDFPYPLPPDIGAHRLPTTYEPTDDERKLAWLQRNVSRTTKELAERHGVTEIRRRLGL